MNITKTENGEVAFQTTQDLCLDFFTKITRDAPVSVILSSFVDAWNQDQHKALQVLLNFRDPRGGKGEKKISRILFLLLKKECSVLYGSLLPLFVRYGCWKDLLHVCEMDPYNCSWEVSLFVQQLRLDKDAESPSLCAKWAPSEGSHFDKEPLRLVRKIRNGLGLSPKAYRKLIGKLRHKLHITEHLMSTKQWRALYFSSIPSRCHALYRKAFQRGENAKKVVDERRITELVQPYELYLSQLKTGTTTIKSSGIHPHEIAKEILLSPDPVLEAQWNEIVKKTKSFGTFDQALAVVDVSSSMSGQPMDVAIALGALVSECSLGCFHNLVITFHESPQAVLLDGDLHTRLNMIRALPWGYNTNIEKVFHLILQKAIQHKIAPRQMIRKLFIFTDMQFDEVNGGEPIPTFKKFEQLYNRHGYELPQIVCWNLRTSANDCLPVEKDDNGVCLLSGFSNELLKSVMEMEEFTPSTLLGHVLAPYVVPELPRMPITLTEERVLWIENSLKK